MITYVQVMIYSQCKSINHKPYWAPKRGNRRHRHHQPSSITNFMMLTACVSNPIVGLLDGDVCDEGHSSRTVQLLDWLCDTSILHHAFILIFIALWAVTTRYVTILMPILSYFTRFT